MNKSKFLKRPLAALLAILMVVAMVPMNALAAVVIVEDVPTARVYSDPGYSIWVDNDKAEWDSENNAYTAESGFAEGSALPDFKVSMIQDAKNTTVTVVETEEKLSNTNVELDPKDAAENTADEFGAGTYTYNLKAEVTDDDGEIVSTNEFKLVITVTMHVASADATIKAVKTAKLPYAIKAAIDNEKNTIDIIMALGKSTTHETNIQDKNNSNVTTFAALKEIFIPSSTYASNIEYTSKKLTVTAENGSKKEYTVNFTSESAFETFQWGEYTGTPDKDDSTVVYVDLPYDEFINAHNGDATDVNTTKLVAANPTVAVSWTVPEGVKVYEGDTAANAKVAGVITSGEFFPAFDTPRAGDSNDANEKDYYIVEFATNDKVFVQTRKSGEPVEVTVKFRVPTKNPSADLTGIQVGSDSVNSSAGNQYYNVTGTTMTVALPAGVSKITGQEVTVWGAYGANVELAKDRYEGDSITFGVDGDGVDITTELPASSGEYTATSETDLDVSAPLILRVISEDGKTTKYYTFNISESTRSNPVLESLEFVDPATGEVVAEGKITNGYHSGKVEVTVPFAVGIDPSSMGSLIVRAVADKSSRIGMGIAGSAEVPAVAAVYDSGAVTPLTADGDLTIGGIAVAMSDTTGANNTIATQLAAWLAGATSSDWDLAMNDNNDGIKFTAKTAGAIGGEGPTTAPTGTTVVTAGADRQPAVGDSMEEFVKSKALDDLMANLASATIPTVGADDGSNNTFDIKVYNDTRSGGEANWYTDYTITVNKKAPSTAAAISSVKVTDKDNKVFTDATTIYSATISGKAIKTETLPYAERKASEGAGWTGMRFTELEASAGAKVLWLKTTKDNSTVLMSVDKDSKASSNPFVTWETNDFNGSWAKNGPVTMLVYSEKDWAAITGSADADKVSTVTTYYQGIAADPDYSATNFPATATYKMTATYAEPERGANLNSIASTLDEKVKVTKNSNTITLTVPKSYLDNGKEFTLDMDVSELATIHQGPTGAKLVSDEGSTDTAHPTKFTVTGTQAAPVLQFANWGGSAYDAAAAFKTSGGVNDEGKLYVVNEAENDRNSWIVNVKVANAESSAEIESITTNGVSAVKDEEEEHTWNLKLPVSMDQVQPLDIKTVSKLADVTVDGEEYDPEGWYDLGADIIIDVKSEDDANWITYTLKIIEGEASSDASVSEIRAGEYTAVKGSGNTWTIKATEDADLTALALNITASNSNIKGITVDGTAYTADMTVDLSEGKVVTIVVTAEDGTTATYTLSAATGSLSDTYTDLDKVYSGHLERVKYAIDNGLMSNDGKVGEFNPEGKIARRDFALIVARADMKLANPDVEDIDALLVEKYEGSEDAFDDISSLNPTQKAAVAYCKENGIVSGNGKGGFNPGGAVSREDAAIMIAGWCKLDVTDAGNTNKIKDWDNINNWAKPYVNAVYKAGLMNGTGGGNFTPARNLNRGEAAYIIVGALEEKSPSSN